MIQPRNCTTCVGSRYCFYSQALPAGAADDQAWRTVRSVSERSLLVGAGEPSDVVYVVHSGWAARFKLASDGQKQILEFLLPGDLVSLAQLHFETVPFSVIALTDLSVCAISRSWLNAAILDYSPLLLRLRRECAEAQLRADNNIFNLGRRSALAAFSRLLLDLRERLSRRGLDTSKGFDLPLRRHDLADALGLTVVHVNRLVAQMRDAGIAEFHSGRAHILDPGKLKALAGAS